MVWTAGCIEPLEHGGRWSPDRPGPCAGGSKGSKGRLTGDPGPRYCMASCDSCIRRLHVKRGPLLARMDSVLKGGCL